MFTRYFTEKKAYVPVFITYMLGVIFQLLFLFGHDFHGLLLNTLPDDAFYYFQIARDIVNGYGSTFDAVNITNGYHPLWMVLILLIFNIFSVGGTFDIAPIYATLTFSLILSALTGIVLAKIFRRFTANPYIIAFGIFFWFFNPYNLYAVLNGLETSLTLLMLALFSLALMRVHDVLENVVPKKSHFVLIGILGGLLILSRLDTIFVVFFGYLYLVYTMFAKGSSENKSHAKLFVLAAVITGVIFFTWQIWNYKTYDMTLTSASITGTYVHHQLTYFDNGGKSLSLILKTMVYMMDRAFEQLVLNTGAPYVVFPLVGVAIYFFAKQARSFWEEVKTRRFSPLWFISIGLIAQMSVSAMIRWLYRDWYFIPTLFILQFVVVYACIQLEKEFKNFRYFLGVLVIISLGLFYISYDKDLQNREIKQEPLYTSVVWQNKNLPEGSIVGSFNAGIQGYFAKYRLVNLDGLVNNTASTYMLNHDMWKYITEVEHLDYISDFPEAITYRYNHFFGSNMNGNDVLRRLQIIHTTESNGNVMNVYKVPKN